MSESSVATQNTQVLEYLMKYGSIDQLRAFEELKIMRLGARIYDLKKSGIAIIGEMQSRKDSSGKTKQWKVYRLARLA